MALLGLLLSSLLDLQVELGTVLDVRQYAVPLKNSDADAYLVDVWFGTGSAGNNLLDKLGNLGHDVHTIVSLAHATGQLSFDAAIRAGPGEGNGVGLGPVALWVVMGSSVLHGICSASVQQLVIDSNTTNIDDSVAVRGGRCKLHHDCAVCGGLEVGKGPAGGGVVGLHALESMDEQATTSQVDGALLSDNASLDLASGPEGVSHLTPGCLGVGSESASTILADNESRSGL